MKVEAASSRFTSVPNNAAGCRVYYIYAMKVEAASSRFKRIIPTAVAVGYP